MLAWVRRHPVRVAVYTVIIAAAVWAGIRVLRDPYGLLARAAASATVRNFVEREFGVRYAVDRLTLSAGCGSVAGLDVELAGVVKARVENGRGCLAGNVEAQGIAVGGQVIRIGSVRFQPPLTVQGEGLGWRDDAGELLSVKRFTATGIEGLDVPEIATVQFASYTPELVEVIGTNAVVDRAALAPVPARFQKAANGLLAIAQAALPYPARWSATAWRLLARVLIGAAVVLLLLKVLVARAPLWALVAPFAIFPLLALTSSWVVIVIAAPVVALGLWALAYRRRAEWHQRWEPVPVDMAAVLLALPMLVLLGWPRLPKLQLPAIDRVTLPRVELRDTAATIREAQCGAGDLAVVTVPRAVVTNLQAQGTNVDVGSASASGLVTAGRVKAPFAVDYSNRRADFSAQLPDIVAVKGSADLTGARLDDIRTLAGAPVQVRRASARVTWPGDLVGRARLEGIAAAGATVDTVRADFRAGMPCGTSNRISASAAVGGIAVSGAVSATVPEAAVTFSGSLAGQQLNGEAGVSTGRLSIPPVRFTADLQSGEFAAPKQHINLAQEITVRLPRSIGFDLEASRTAVHVFIPKLIPDVAPAALELTDLQIDVDSAGPRYAMGGNKLTLPELPSGFTLGRIANLHVTTHGELQQAPELELPSPKLPAIDVAQIVPRNLRVSLPGLKLESIDLETAGPVEARIHVTDATADATVSKPLAARASATATAVRLGLTAPLDTALFGILGTVRELHASAEFAQNRLAGFDVAGVVEAGPLTAPAAFHVTNTHASFSAPSITLLPGLWLSAAGALDFTLTPSPAYPVLERITEAAAGIRDHVQNASRVFGNPDAAVFPIRWDLDLNVGSASLGPEKLAADVQGAIRNLEAAQQTFDGSAALSAEVALADDHLLVRVAGPADLGALGRRWKLDSPVSIALRKELRPGSSGSFFDTSYYRPFTLALGYGDALQAHTALHAPVLYGTAEGVVDAAIHWQPAAAEVDSLGKFSFAGLTPDPYLEDRLDGEFRFGTKAMPVDRFLVPQILADASRLAGLDHLDLSLAVRRSQETAALPGMVQIAMGLDLKPANEALRLITDRLNIAFPPSALTYRDLALNFNVEQGRIHNTHEVLKLSGVQMQGVNGLVTDTDLRIFLGGRGRLRDLVYNFQRAFTQ
jgi:hypothetical protein